jgi:ribosomal protein S18 acetylase RimI-like enzyme
MSPVTARPLHDDERDWLRATLAERWAGETVVGRGRVHRPAELPAIVAVDGAERVGVLTYVVDGGVAEIVTIDALRAGTGAGAALLAAVADAARSAGVRRLRVMTTNDNVRALRFYQRHGFRLVALRAGAVEHARRRKPSIPVSGNDGIPIRDELDLVRDL